MLAAAAWIVVLLGTLGAGSARAQTPPAVTLSAGVFHTCAVTPSGGVQCWGANGDATLGDGTNLDRNLPVDVVGLSSGVAAISAGWDHSCALTTTGGVKCWGDNSGGQLGDGTNFRRTAPVDVIGLSSGVTAISAGGFHTCAVMTAGGMKCWGDNTYGQIGDATHVDRSLPVDVTGLPSAGVGAIAAGYYHTCTVSKSAQVICWGANFSGQLGTGTTTDSSTPVYEAGLVSDAVAITAGEAHTCALTARSGVKCWGDNGYGQLGDGTFGNSPYARDVPGLSSGVAGISSHGISTCAVTTAGGATCWGDNFRGQLGDGTTGSSGTPVGVTGLSSGVAAVAAGYYHGCALSTTGAVKCWGWNRFGELGDGTNTNSLVPVDVPGTFAVPSVAAPANDNFANAEVLTSATSNIVGTVAASTRESGENPYCASFAGSVWYRWTPDRNGQAYIQSPPNGFCLALWQGSSLGSLTPVDAVSSGLGGQIFSAVAGTTYYFSVEGSPVGSLASFTLARLFIAAPANDNFANAEVLASDTSNITGTLAGATRESSEPSVNCSSSAGGSVWYRWTPSGNGLAFVGVPSGSCIEVWQGGSLGSLAAVDSASFGLGQGRMFRAVAGATYYFTVVGDPGNMNGFTIGRNFIAGPANDDFAQAEVLTSASTSITGSLAAATRESGEPAVNCSTSLAGTVWYHWTPDRNGLAFIAAATSGFCLEVWRGNSLGSLTAVNTAPAFFGAGHAFPVVASATYYFAVAGDPANLNAFTFGRSFIAAPANDNFADAEVLASATSNITGAVAAATRESGEPSVNCPSSAGGSVWYRWTADRYGQAFVQDAPANFCVEVWQGNSLGALAAVATTSFGFGGGRTFPAVAGATYYFAVAGDPLNLNGFTLGRNFVAADFVDAHAGPGGTITTDADGGGASPADPIATTVTTPVAGSVSIAEFQQSLVPGPFTVLNFVVQITAPAATAANPLTITFVIDGSALPAGVTAATLQLFRNGVLVPACTGAPAAVPDPCVASRATFGDDAVLTIVTSRASSWTFGVNPAPTLLLPANIIVDATSPSGATVTYEATAADVIDGAVAVSCAPAPGSMFSINPIEVPATVTCSATDSDGNTASGTFTVHVRGAAEQIALLAEEVAAAISIIGEKVSDDLHTKLGDAASRLSGGKIDDACGKLSDFSSKVIAKTPKDIPASLASDWLARADRIRMVLGCGAD